MLSFTKVLNRKLLFLALLSFSTVNQIAVAQSTGNFQASGEILELTTSHINVGDLAFRMSPTVKVKIPGIKQASTNDLKVGDHVGITLLKYNGKHLVDSIQRIPGQLNNE